MRCLWVGWVLMTWVSGMMCAAGFLLPYWLKGLVQGHVTDLGLFRRCVFPSQNAHEVVVRLDCGHYSHFVDIPSVFWKIAFVTLAMACCLLLLLTFFLAFIGFRLELMRIRSVIGICAIAQIISSVLIMMACLFYPLGWKDNLDVENACGLHQRSEYYRIGDCHVGWAYVLTVASGFLSSLTVAFPIQMGRLYPDIEIIQSPNETKNVCNVAATPCAMNICSNNRQSPMIKGRYKYVTYHALDGQQNRPLSQCTCTSDYTGQHVPLICATGETDLVEISAASPITSLDVSNGVIVNNRIMTDSSITAELDIV